MQIYFDILQKQLSIYFIKVELQINCPSRERFVNGLEKIYIYKDVLKCAASNQKSRFKQYIGVKNKGID